MTLSRSKALFSGLALLILIVAVAILVVAIKQPSSTFDSTAFNTSSPASQALIDHGREVARQGDCASCHSLPGKAPFSGGLSMATPIGKIFTTNITPDRQHGIGEYTLADFDRAVRHGKARNGHWLYPAMPYPSFAHMSDDDVKALYAYFMHGVNANDTPNQATTIPWPLNMRWPLAVWDVLFGNSAEYRFDQQHSAQWNRGAYLVQGAGHCGSCHTPRGLGMNEKGYDQSSQDYLAGAGIDNWFAPDLRGDASTGLGRWSEQEIAQYLKTGRNVHGVAAGSMGQVVNNSTQFMSDDDRLAIAHYLKSLPASHSGDGANTAAGTNAQASAQDSAEQLRQQLKDPSAQLYATHCAACHGRNGEGQGQWIPALAGTASSLSSHAATTMNAILNGSGRLFINNRIDAYRMPSFRNKLSDQQIADIASYVRTHWGNTGGKVSASEVHQVRTATQAASSQPELLPTP